MENSLDPLKMEMRDGLGILEGGVLDPTVYMY